MSFFCPHCGKELALDARFCWNCGQASLKPELARSNQNIDKPPEPPLKTDPTVESKLPEQKKSASNSQAWIGVLVGLAVVIGANFPSCGSPAEDNTNLAVDSPAGTTTAPPIFTTAPPTQPVSTITTNPPSITVSPAPTQTSSQSVNRSYKWSFKDSQWTWDLILPQSLYDYYKGLPRSPTRNYSVYVTHPSDDLYVDALVTKIKDAAKSKGYSEFETIEFAAAFVQSLPYTTDNVTTKFDEYPRYPIETLFDNGGDCEDTSILMASIVRSMGYGVVLLVFDPVAGSSGGHVAVGVKGGENVYGTYWNYAGSKYYYLETTGDNWGIGELPAEYKTASAYIYDMVPVPILTHTWTSTGHGLYADLKVVVTNLGSAEAQNVYVYAAFDAGANLVWSPQNSPTFTIGIDQTVTITISIKVPLGEHTRILVKVVYGGYSVDSSYSDWFDT